MFDPKVLIILALLGLSYEFYEHTVKPAAVKTAHVVKAGAKKAVHILRKVV